jgi:hypothetical protein
MIALLSEEEQRNVSKQSVKDLEFKILMQTGFDYSYPGPMQSMERFLRILSYDRNKTVYDMTY